MFANNGGDGAEGERLELRAGGEAHAEVVVAVVESYVLFAGEVGPDAEGVVEMDGLLGGSEFFRHALWKRHVVSTYKVAVKTGTRG